MSENRTASELKADIAQLSKDLKSWEFLARNDGDSIREAEEELREMEEELYILEHPEEYGPTDAEIDHSLRVLEALFGFGSEAA